MIPAYSCQTIVDNLATSIVLLDSQLCIHYLNPAAEALLGVSLKQIHHASINALLIASKPFIKTLKQALSQDHTYTERELEIVLATSKRTIKVDYSVTPLMQGGALIVEFQLVDRMLRIVGEENLRTQQHALKSLLQGLAHEIKNPLGGLRGAAQLLARQLPDASLTEYTQVIIREADRLHKLVDRMLGPMTLPNKKNINIHAVIEQVRQLIEAESVEFTILRDYDPSLPEIYGDHDQLVQAVLNIVKNAYQALDGKGQVTLRTRSQRHVSIGKARHRLVASIEVIDHGPGIPGEAIEQIFYPMVTSRAEGTGLGLPIAQTIITQHDGIIKCVSLPGETVFTILLPLITGDMG